MSASTTFSVIITSYNYRTFVTDAVDSVLAQVCAPRDIIVVDDGSTDGSAELLRERYGNDPRVTLLCVENGGQLSAFVHGLQYAKGEVVCFLDSDDYWSMYYLQKIAEVYDRQNHVDFIVSDMQVFGEEQRVIGYGRKAVDFGYTAISTAVIACWYGAPTSALSMRRRWAEASLDLPQRFLDRWKLSADNCLVYGASVFGARKMFLPTGSVHYRIHDKNGWWANRSATLTYTNRLYSRVLIDHYADIVGLRTWSAELAKLEYRTKPDPSWPETRRYMSISLRSNALWWKRIEQALSILVSWIRKH